MRWLLPLGLFAIASIAGFWLALNAIPGVIMGKAMDRIGALGSEAGDVRHAPRLREDNQTIVRASPDILYSVCVYDVSDGPVVVEAPWPADGNYTSVSFYDARTNNFAVFSDRDGDASPVGIVLTGNADTAEVPAGFHAVDHFHQMVDPGKFDISVLIRIGMFRVVFPTIDSFLFNARYMNPARRFIPGVYP